MSILGSAALFIFLMILLSVIALFLYPPTAPESTVRWPSTCPNLACPICGAHAFRSNSEVRTTNPTALVGAYQDVRHTGATARADDPLPQTENECRRSFYQSLQHGS